MPSVLIIGSGISGLTSAVLLAEHGWQVTVLEAHAIPGGLMQRFRRGPYWFDTGFHFITGSEPEGLFRKLARRLGTLERMRFLPLDESAQFRIHLPGEPDVDLPVGLAASRQALATRWPEQAAAIARFFDELADCMAGNAWLADLPSSGTARLQPGPLSSSSSASHFASLFPTKKSGARLEPGVPGAGNHASVAQVLARCGMTGPPKEILGCLTAILAMKPEHCTLELYAGFAGTALAGSYRAEGGGEALVKPLIERLKALGGTLLVNHAATRIHWNGRSVTAVEDKQGKQHAADLVISTCHPEELLRLTGPGGLRPSLERRVRETPDSASALLVFAGLARAPRTLGRRHHLARIGADGDLYYLAPSNFSEHEQDSEPAYLEAMVWVSSDSAAAWRDTTKNRRPEDYEAWKRAREAEILAAIFALHPELEGTVERVWSSTPLSIEHYVRSRHGAALGLSHDIGYLGTEPIPHRSRLKNLLLAGQSAGHPGVIGCTIGAFVLVESILGKDLCREVMAGRGPSR